MSTSTLNVPMTQSSTMGVSTQWTEPVKLVQINESIMLGIEQARKNEGTFLDDDDLAADDDD